jgi:hypothetical protein
MLTDPFLCHLWIWALARLPADWLVRDLEIAPWRHRPRARA